MSKRRSTRSASMENWWSGPEQVHLGSSRATATMSSESVPTAQHDVRMLVESLALATLAPNCASITSNRYTVRSLKKPPDVIDLGIAQNAFNAVKSSKVIVYDLADDADKLQVDAEFKADVLLPVPIRTVCRLKQIVRFCRKPATAFPKLTPSTSPPPASARPSFPRPPLKQRLLPGLQLGKRHADPAADLDQRVFEP